jgi:hypothetical protein
MSAPELPWRVNGQYEHAMSSINAEGHVAALVHEKLDKFFDEIHDKLNRIDCLAEDDVKGTIMQALVVRFGKSYRQVVRHYFEGPDIVEWLSARQLRTEERRTTN